MKARRMLTKYNLNTEGDRYAEKNGQIYLGLDVWVDKDPWLVLQMQKKATIYLKDLTDIVWTPKKLVNRCFKLNKSIVMNINPESPRKELELDRLQLLQELYEDYLENRGIKEAAKKLYIVNMRRILTLKIQDLRAHYKRMGSK